MTPPDGEGWFDVGFTMEHVVWSIVIIVAVWLWVLWDQDRGGMA